MGEYLHSHVRFGDSVRKGEWYQPVDAKQVRQRALQSTAVAEASPVWGGVGSAMSPIFQHCGGLVEHLLILALVAKCHKIGYFYVWSTPNSISVSGEFTAMPIARKESDRGDQYKGVEGGRTVGVVLAVWLSTGGVSHLLDYDHRTTQQFSVHPITPASQVYASDWPAFHYPPATRYVELPWNERTSCTPHIVTAAADTHKRNALVVTHRFRQNRAAPRRVTSSLWKENTTPHHPNKLYRCPTKQQERAPRLRGHDIRLTQHLPRSLTGPLLSFSQNLAQTHITGTFQGNHVQDTASRGVRLVVA